MAAVLAVTGAAVVTGCGAGGSDSPTVAAPTATQNPTTQNPAAQNPAAQTPSTTDPSAAAPATSPGSSTAAGPGTLTDVPLTTPAALATGALATPRTLQAPAGSSVAVWARVPGARFELWTAAGDLLVSVPSQGEIVRLHPGADPAATPTQSVLVGGLTSPQGMAFDTVDGKTVLYVAESDALVRYAWNGTSVGAMTMLVAGLPGAAAGYAHPLKEVVVAADHSVYFDVASATNADPANRAAGEAVIMRLAPGAAKPTVVMTGVRNGDGLAFDPTGQLWTAVNMRDNVANPAGVVDQTYVNDHPPDEIAKVTQGRDLGWPYCDPDQTLTGSGDAYGQIPLRDDPQVDAAKTVDCSTLPPVDRGIPAHSAPLGLHFLQGTKLPAAYLDGAVLGTHGSNDHVPPRPAELYWLPFDQGTLGAVQPLLAGFLDATGDRWGKPVDAAAGPDGALYVSDDTAGAVYRLVLAAASAASKA